MRRRARTAEYAVSCQVWTSAPDRASSGPPYAGSARSLRIEHRGPRDVLVEAQVLAVSPDAAVAALDEILQARLQDPDAVITEWRAVRKGRFLNQVTGAYGSVATGPGACD